MRDRVGRRIKGMTDDERLDIKDEMTLTISDVEVLSGEVVDGEFEDMDDLKKQMGYLEREIWNLDDKVLQREIEGVLSELSDILNKMETERRRQEDEKRGHMETCKAFSRKLMDMGLKLKRMDGRI